MATESSSKTAVDEAPKEGGIWLQLRLLQTIVVQSRLGQTLLKLVDNFLWTVEKCAEWSLPRQDVGEDGKNSGKPELVRPLPWIFFLPSLVILRLIRVTVNIGASILGYPAITPSGMVKFVQISRRHLNASMNKGTNERHKSKDKRPAMNEAKKALIRSIRLTLSSLSCLDASKPSLSPPPTKIYVSSILNPESVTTSEERSVTESTDSTAKLKRATSESEEEKEETLNEKIDRLALECSEDDEDFDPAKCSSSDANSDEDDDDDDDENNDSVSPSEIHDVIEDAKTFHKNLNNIKQTESFLKAEQISAQDTKQESIKHICGERSSAKESRDKVEERFATSQRIDSPECCTPDRSSQEGDPIFYSPISSDSDAPKVSSAPNAEKCASRKILKTNEFINGEARFISASTNSESKSSGQTNNGTVVEKRNTNVSKCHKGKRTSHGNRKKK